MAALLALGSSIVWGTADFLGGVLSRRREVLAVLAGSQPFGLLAAALVATFAGAWSAPRGYLLWGALAGTVGLIGLVSFYAALAAGRMGIVSPLAALGVLVPLAIGLLNGEQPSSLQYVGIVIAIVGVVLASGPELSGGADAKPVLLALASAVTFGLAVYFMALGGRYSFAMTVVTMRVVQVAALLVVVLLRPSARGLHWRDVPLLALTGSADAIANLLFAAAAATGALLSLVSVLGSLFPVVTVLLAWWFLHERLATVQYVGVVAAMAGVIAITAG